MLNKPLLINNIFLVVLQVSRTQNKHYWYGQHNQTHQSNEPEVVLSEGNVHQNHTNIHDEPHIWLLVVMIVHIDTETEKCHENSNKE